IDDLDGFGVPGPARGHDPVVGGYLRSARVANGCLFNTFHPLKDRLHTPETSSREDCCLPLAWLPAALRHDFVVQWGGDWFFVCSCNCHNFLRIAVAGLDGQGRGGDAFHVEPSELTPRSTATRGVTYQL